jgi:hypothetical protein
MYILNEHSLAIERGRYREPWLLREDRLCAHYPQNEVETDLHFLTCQMYDHIEDTYFPQITHIPKKEFENNSSIDIFPYLCAVTAATCVARCHEKRATSVKTPYIYLFIYLPFHTSTIYTLLPII